MGALIVESDAKSVTIQITIPYESTMLSTEESIQSELQLDLELVPSDKSVARA